MKRTLKALALIACLATLAFASCTKNNEELILGKWEVTTAPDASADIIGSQWEFFKTGTFILNIDESTVQGTYSVNKDKLTMTVSNDPQTVTIKEITKSKMTWNAPMYNGSVGFKKI